MQGKVRATAGKRRHRHADGHGSHDREGPLRDLPDSPYRLIFRWPEGVGQRAVGPALAEMEASLAPKWGEMWARLAKKFAQKSPRQVPRFMSRSATCGPTPSGSSSRSPTRAVAAVHYGGRIQVRELEYAQAAETLCGCFQNGLKVDWGPRLSHGVQKPRLTHTVCTRRGRHLVETETVTFQVTDDGYPRRSATGPFKARAAIRWRNMDGFEAQVAGRLLAR